MRSVAEPQTARATARNPEPVASPGPPQSTLRAGYLACAGLVSIYACAATALSLARRREADLAASVTTALAVFLVAQRTTVLQGGGTALGLATLGAAGLFPAFAAAIF